MMNGKDLVEVSETEKSETKALQVKMKALCKEIGDCFGEFFEENNQLCIDNGETVFRYKTEKALLTDWVDTLVYQHRDCNGKAGGNWEEEVRFIYEKVLRRYPRCVRAYRGKTKTTYKAEVCVPDGTPHGKMLYLGGFTSMIDAICAVWDFKRTGSSAVTVG